MSSQAVPLASGATVIVTGNSIDGFTATAAGTVTITPANGGPVIAIPVAVGFNGFSQPISASAGAVGGGTAQVVSSGGAAGTLNVIGPPGAALSPPPTTCTVAQLPAPATTAVGTRAMVSNASVAYTTANVGSTVAGGGANVVPVFNNGANWVIG